VDGRLTTTVHNTRYIVLLPGSGCQKSEAHVLFIRCGARILDKVDARKKHRVEVKKNFYGTTR
jgi:hypothetical protein